MLCLHDYYYYSATKSLWAIFVMPKATLVMPLKANFQQKPCMAFIIFDLSKISSCI